MIIAQQSKADILEDYARYVNPGRVAVFKQMGPVFGRCVQPGPSPAPGGGCPEGSAR